MRFMTALTGLVVGMSRIGEHLLKRKASGIIVAALAFACGASLTYALKREPPPAPAPPVSVAVPLCETAATPAPVAAVPAYDDEEEEYGTRELQEWKNRHSGTTLPLNYDAETLDWGLSEEKVIVLPSGRMLASAGGTIYMLDAAKRVIWQHEVSWRVNDFAYVEATGLVYGTGGDNIMVILNAATGERLFSNSREGRGGYGAVLPYGKDVCLVADALGGYNSDYRGGYAPMQDGVTAWRGTRMLWEVAVPPDAELQVVGSKIYAVTKTRTRILVKEIKPPKAKR